MGYYWAATPQPSEQLAAELGLDDEFADQSMAEAWLTDNHTELAHGGIHEISLYAVSYTHLPAAIRAAVAVTPAPVRSPNGSRCAASIPRVRSSRRVNPGPAAKTMQGLSLIHI